MSRHRDMNWVEVLEAIAATSDSRRHVDQLRRTAIGSLSNNDDDVEDNA